MTTTRRTAASRTDARLEARPLRAVPGSRAALWLAALAQLWLSLSCSPSVSPWTLASPSGSLEIRVTLQNRVGERDFPDSRALYYEVRRDGHVVLGASPLGIETDAVHFRDDLVLESSTERRVHDAYTTVVGKRRMRSLDANERTMRFRAPGGEHMELVLRAHNDGIAFRYRVLGQGAVTVLHEDSGFSLPDAARAWLAPFDLSGILAGTYEHAPIEQAVGTSAGLSSGFVYPALFELAADEFVMVTESDSTAAYCVTRLDGEPVGGLYRVRLPEDFEGLGVGAALPTSTLPLETPFRVVMIGSASTLVESTLVDDLAAPSVLADTSWIEPGRAAWSWPTQGTGDVALATSYAAFASSMGWEYVLIDADWDQWPSVETAMPAFVAAAEAQSVRVLLWYNSGGAHNADPGTPRDRLLDPTARETEFAMLESWGVVGIKVDFFLSDKQDRIAQYLGILEDAARHHLVVNFHGATLPRGWFRTHPNLLTVEAVRGGEYYSTGAALVPTPKLLVLDTFIRNVVGPMDFTPVLFDSAFTTGGVGYGASLAESVAFESGIQHFADRADGSTVAGYGAAFAAHPFVREFMEAVPVSWDETRLLDGAPRTHSVLARRHGNEWWIAGLDAGTGARTFHVPLGVLGGPYHCRVATGGADGKTLTEETHDVVASDVLDVSTVSGDGFLAWCAPLP